MLRFILAIFLLPSFFIMAEEEHPISVLIIGGGPAGLASALEAASHGYNVTIVEKRTEYTTMQPIILFNKSLDLLKKWNIVIPEMMLGKITDDKSADFSLLMIQYIENHLAKKCSEIGIKFIYGEFQEFCSNQMIVVNNKQESIFISYDILIAADGFHSPIKKALSFQTTNLGTATGAYFFIPNFSNQKIKSISSEIEKVNNYFIKIAEFRYLTSILIQSTTNITLESIRDLLEMIGLKKEVRAIDEGFFSDLVSNIPIQLNQAQTFFDLEKSVLLIGDAAITVSFLSGDGLNTAFSSIKCLGDFLQLYPYDRKTAFENYNASMKDLTDKVIERNQKLFIDNKTEAPIQEQYPSTANTS